MAEITESYTLCSFIPSEFLGVEAAPDKDCVLATFKSHVDIYQVEDQKLLYSWSTRRTQPFTCPVIYCPETEEFLGIQKANVLRVWFKENSVDAANKLTFKTPIYKLIYISGQFPIVIFENGYAHNLFISFETKALPKKSILLPEETICWCDCDHFNSVIYVVILAKDKRKQNYKVYILQLSSNGTYVASVKSFALQLVDQSQCLSCCLKKETTSCKLYSLGSDGSLSSMDISSAEEVDVHGTLLCQMDTVQKNSPTALVSLDPSHIAFIGLLSKDKKGTTVSIFNSVFELIQAEKHLPSPLLDSLKVRYLNGFLFVPCSNNLIIFPISLRSSLLSLVVGKQEQQLKHGEYFVPTLSWNHSKADENPEVTTTLWLKQNVEETCLKFVLPLVDPKQTPNLNQFKIKFQELVKSKDVVSYIFNSTYMHRIITRIIQEKSFWPREQIKKIIEMKLVTIRSYKEFFDILVEKREVFLLYVCLKNLQDISESVLIRCLNLFLSLNDSELNGLEIAADVYLINKEDNSNNSCPLDIRIATVVNQILAYRSHKQFLVGHLKTLPFDLVILLTKYLLHLMYICPIYPVSDQNGLSLEKVAEWAGILLDSHFNHFILAIDSHDLLLDLRTRVKEEMIMIGELGHVEELLSMLKRKKTINNENTESCFHVLHVY